jgi:hypothetical protein
MSLRSERQIAIRLAGLLPLVMVTSTLAFAPKPARAQTPVTIVGCGTEGGRACGGGDPEFWANNIDGTGQACDYGLIVSGNTCLNGNRHTAGDYRQDAIGKALHDQLYSAQADQPVTYDVFLGSHNTFSSYRSDVRQKSLVQTGIPIPILNVQVGITPGLIADQELSVSDQLTRGARFIVLHPHFYQGQLRVCHENAGDWAETIICGNETSGRLFSYVAQEIAAWLDKNPGEFVLMRLLHDVGASHTDQMTEILNHYLGAKIYKPDYQTWFANQSNPTFNKGGVPSLRQLRSQGYQIMVIGSETDGPNQPISSIMWNWGLIVENDGYSDSTGWGNCENTDGNSILNHPTQFAYTAEDRSGSNAITAAQVAAELALGTVESGSVQVWNGFVNFVTGSNNSSSSYYNPGGAGLLDQNAVRHALACTYSIIGLDFWESGQNAYVGALYPPFIPFADYRSDIIPTDPRQRAALFTYQPTGSTPGFTTPEPVYTNGTTGWQPDTENSGHIYNRFLCASLGSISGAPVSRANLDGWTLNISSSAGEWEQGESICLNEFGANWHFWAPETPHEQSKVNFLLNLYGRPTIWLNTKVAPPGQRPPLVLTPSAVTIYWHKGQQAPPPMPYLFTKGGTGGTLSVKPALANGEQSLFVHASNNGATLWAAFDNVALNKLSAGDHYNNVVVTETDPVYGTTTYTVPVMVEVDEMLQVSTPSVDLGNCSGPGQAVAQVQSGGPFTIASTEPWLKVAASATQSPATLTFSVLPSAILSPGNYTAVVTITGQFAINSSVTVKVNLKVSSATTVSSLPMGLSLLVDGASTVTPKTYCWAPGESHTVSAPAAIPGATGTELMFSKWSDGGAVAHTIRTSNTIATLAAVYLQAYLVTAVANPATGGTVSGGGWYTSGQAATISAAPNPGFTFTSFSGPLTSTVNPLKVPVSAPVTVTANFSAPRVSLTAKTAGSPSEGRQDGTRNIPLQIANASAAAVTGVVVTAVDQFSTVSGTGTAVALSTFPINVGTLEAGRSGAFNLLLRWPTTAGQITFVVHFTANNGTYSGSTPLTITLPSRD